MDTSGNLEASIFRPANICAIITSPICWHAAQSSQCLLQRQTAVTWPVFEVVVILFTRLILQFHNFKSCKIFSVSVTSSSSSAWLVTWYFKELGFIPITNSHAAGRPTSHSHLMKYDGVFNPSEGKHVLMLSTFF